MDARVVDQDVNAAEIRLDFSKESLNLIDTAYIQAIGMADSAGFFVQLCSGFLDHLLVDICQDDLGPFKGEFGRGSVAKTAGPTGNNNKLSFQSGIHTKTPFRSILFDLASLRRSMPGEVTTI